MAATTPTILQFEASECALAALAMLLGQQGCAVSLEELRLAAGISRDGVSLARLKTLAAAYGFRARTFRRELDALAAMPLPCMVFINFNHMVVVEAVSAEGYLVNDPATGPRLMERAEMDRAYSGLVLILEATYRARQRPPVRPPWPLAWPRWLILALTAALAAGSAEIAALLTLGANRGTALSAAALAGLTMGGGLLLSRRRLVRGGSAWAWQRLSAQSPGYLVNRSAAVLQQLLAMPEQWAEQLTGSAGQTLIALTVSLMPLAALALLLPAAAALVLAGQGLLAGMNLWSHWRRRSAWRRTLTKGNGDEVLGPGDLAVLEILQLAGRDDDALIALSGSVAHATSPLQHLAAALSRSRSLDLLTLATVLAATAWLAPADSRLTLVGLAALALSPWLALPELLRAGFALPHIRSALTDLAQENQTPPPADHTGLPRGRLVVADLSFGYGHSVAPLLEGVNLDLAPGQSLGLGGPSGSGKTTLAKLLAGTLQARSGSVRAGGPVLRVPAAPVLFTGTVADNLTLGQTGFSAAALTDALALAGLTDETASRGGLAAPVEDRGRNWSGGQRRRLMLARALVRGPAILIIDEALDGVDRAKENAILDGLGRRGITLVLISQRRESLAQCDLHLHLGPMEDSGMGSGKPSIAARAEAAPAAVPGRQTAALGASPPKPERSLTPAAWPALSKAAQRLGVSLPATAPPRLDLMGAARRQGLLLRPVALDGAPLPRQGCLPLLARRGNTWLALLPDWRGRYPALAAAQAESDVLYAVHRRSGQVPPRFRLEALCHGLGLAALWGGWLLGAWALAAAALPLLIAALVAVAAGSLAAQEGEARWRAVLSQDAGTALWGRLLRLSPDWVHRQPLGPLAAAAHSAADLARKAPPARLQVLVLSLAVTAGIALTASLSPRSALALLALLLPLGGALVALAWQEAKCREDGDGQRVTASRFLAQAVAGFAEFRALGAGPALFQRWRETAAPVVAAEQRSAACKQSALWLQHWSPLAAALLLGPDVRLAALAAVSCAALGVLAQPLALLLLARRTAPALAARLAGPDESRGDLPPAGPQTLSLRDVHFRYGDQPVLAGVNLDLAPGEVVALMAPTGSGKTTLLRLLLGYLHPQAGHIRYGGQDLESLDRMTLRAAWGAVQQDEGVPGGLLRRYLGGLHQGASRRAWRAAALAGLQEDIAALPMGMATPVSSAMLSSGQEQKILLGRTLVQSPALVVLDEALSALDGPSRRHILNVVRALGAACVVVTHDPDTLALCDRQLRLHQGRLESVVAAASTTVSPPLRAMADNPDHVPSDHESAQESPGLYRQRALDLADAGAQVDHLPALLPLPLAASALGLAALLTGVLLV